MKGSPGNRRRDFTTGSIPRHLVFFSLPMLVGNVFQALYNTVDSIWVGRFVGPAALGAVSVSFPIIFVLIALVLGLGTAATALVAQYAGANRQDRVQAVVSNTLVVVSFGAVILTFVGIGLRRPVLALINTPPEILEMAASYLGIFAGGFLFFFLFNATGAVLRGLGDSRTPVQLLVYAVALNIALDPLLIFGVGPLPALGVPGVAWATVISQALAAFLGLRHLGRLGFLPKQLSEWKLEPSLLALLGRVGLPAGIQQVLVSLGILTVRSVINEFGTVVVAAVGATSRIDSYIFMPAMTGSLAVSALVGQNLGAGKEERVREVVKWSVLLNGGITAVIALAVYALPGPIIAIFTPDRQVIEVGIEYLRIVSFSYLPFGLMFVLGGVMRGAGDTLPSMIFTLISLWLVRIPLVRYLSSLPTLAERGIWLGITVSAVVGFFLSLAYYLSGRWKCKVAVQAAETGAEVEAQASSGLLEVTD